MRSHVHDKANVQNCLCVLHTYRILILSKESKKKKCARKIFQFYQLILMIGMKLRTLQLTNVNELLKLLAMIFPWKQCRGNVKRSLV